MPYSKEIKMSLHSLWSLKLLHHLVVRLREARYDLGGIVSMLHFFLRKSFVEDPFSSSRQNPDKDVPISSVALCKITLALSSFALFESLSPLHLQARTGY